MSNQKPNNNPINPELHEYAYPFHYQSENNNGLNNKKPNPKKSI